MEKLNDLNDLLRHEVLDLYSAEEQILEALPAMIEKAGSPALKAALQQHLSVTDEQKNRLDKVKDLLSDKSEETVEGEKKRGFIAGLFHRSEAKQVCLGTKGIIEEGKKVMNENMEPDVLDAAIIGCAQKVEHYEICGYGTAKAYAKELGLTEVENLLNQTLNEEYEADDKLTALAVGRINKEAENDGPQNRRPASTNGKTPSAASKTPGGRGDTASRTSSSSPSGKAPRKASAVPKNTNNKSATAVKKGNATTATKKAATSTKTTGVGTAAHKSAGKKTAAASKKR